MSDAAAQTPLAAVPDRHQIERLNTLWAIVDAPLDQVGWRSRLGAAARRLMGRILSRQQEFNAAAVNHLNRNMAVLEDLHRDLRLTSARLDDVDDGMTRHREALLARERRREASVTALASSQEELRTAVGVLQQASQSLRREVARLAVAPAGSHPGDEAGHGSTPASQFHAFDSHKYVGFEDQFRGSADEIRRRVSEYLPVFEGGSDVLDVGCGRGEFLALLRDRGISARGIDLNPAMVEVCRAQGLDATAVDALTYLRAQPDASLGGLFAAQVVEHLEPRYLAELLDAAFDKLRPGAPLVLETINPACWFAFFESYIRDITHVRALHPDTLKYLVVATGFHQVEIRYRAPYPESEKLQPVAPSPDSAAAALADWTETINANVEKINRLLFTFLDYAAIGRQAVIARACRLLIGAALVWSVVNTAAAPDISRACAAAALAILGCSLWSPGIGLVLIAALTPAGLLLAPAPVRAAEFIAWAFLAGWLLGVWRPLARTPWPRPVAIPALLYAASAVASWLGMTIGGAAGVGPMALPLFLFHALPPDHLLFSSPEPETWTLLQTLAGTGLLLAALGLTRDDPRVARGVAYGLVASMAVLSVATLVSVVHQWSRHEYATWFMRQYISSERFTLHLSDLNAAGSQYVLAGLTALGLAAFDRPRRWIWLGLLAVMTPAAWLTGSRSAGLGAALIGVLTLATAAPGRRWKPTRGQVAALATTIVLVLVASALVLARDANVKGSAGRAMRLRTQFSQTSARMFASSPIFGVGIGQYHGRSGEFMPDELRSLYGFENAHNYFAQEFAELGLVGGTVFIWLVAALIQVGWRRVRANERLDGVTTGLFAGTVGYLVTCVTGHPLLVSEAAFPFWVAIGAMAGISLQGGDALPSSVAGFSAAPRHGAMAVVLVIALALAADVGRGVLAYARVTPRPSTQGFHPIEAAADGTRFQWTARHAITYVDNGLGFLTVTMRAPDTPRHLPVIVETQIEGRTVDRRELPPGRWVTTEIPVRQPTRLAFRRVDLRVNQMWTRQQLVGRRMTDDLLGVMVRDIRWIPAGSRR